MLREATRRLGLGKRRMVHCGVAASACWGDREAMNRRDMLRFVAGGFPAATLAAPGRLLGSTSVERTRLGVCVYCLGIRSRAERARATRTDFTDPLSFLEYCRRLGAGGPFATLVRPAALGRRASLMRPGLVRVFQAVA